MLLTRSFARKMFGEQDPLGKNPIQKQRLYRNRNFERHSGQQFFRFDVLIPDRPEFSRMMSEFIVLKEKVGIQSVKEKIASGKILWFPAFQL